MSSVLRQHSALFGAVGTGLFVGIGGAIFYMRLANSVLRQLVSLSNTIAELRNEVLELKQKLESSRPRRRFRGYFSAPTSSGEEDTDAYEDAYDDGPELSTTTSDSYQDVLTEPEDDNKSTSSGKQSKEDDLFEQVDKLYLTDVEYYWRLAKSTYQVGQIEGSRGNEEKKKELLYEAKDLASKAVNLNEKVLYNEHIERAIDLNPKDPSNHHLLGRWCFGVYMLSWIERKAAGALYATPPTSTAEEALQHFMEAENLNPGVWKENMLYIAKCYIEVGKYKEAKEWLEKAQRLPVISQDDKTSQTEIDSLLTKT
ncbi:hypothetical protein KUTeg_013476 [Tegillarca granosa]|uniref:Regulator of microtubule dynamics protein 3 n=1 Tax=Tegillarca granosa TaxID=220873 RepID=A0ABQ9ETT8_TEGGR|nr:hypothetical protein KUTeg_013476 [Tegillarca granosa]